MSILQYLLHEPLIAADYCEERGEYISAAWLGEEGCLPPKATAFHGSGSGHGYGDGEGDGHGHGHGSGSGTGYGYGYGGCGSGGCGSGGGGSGRGHGHGHGSGTGYGDGYGDGYGSYKETETLYSTTNQEEYMPAIGDYVIVRSRDQGCMCGEYQGHIGREVRLTKARQIYSWSGQRLTLVDFSVVPGECRLSRVSAGEVVMLEACGIIPTSPEVESALRGAENG